MKPMRYKGYSARIEYSDEDECFVGRVAGIRDIITFHGDTVEEIRQAFKVAMDFYLDTCAQRGESPNKAYSGKLFLRVPSEVHAAVAIAAETSGKSINQWALETFEKAAHHED
ncbi:MAG: type II toxin-antitoxin system HicB family antitoxin [Deltaproteobacteria bacterium]|nr:type II toxin-antitoxin system HicB family antitoxin [Deltaproteobacteria bacterium]